MGHFDAITLAFRRFRGGKCSRLRLLAVKMRLIRVDGPGLVFGSDSINQKNRLFTLLIPEKMGFGLVFFALLGLETF